MPPENFNALVDGDFKAYLKVNPNFVWGGHWFAKSRYGMCHHQGSQHVIEMESKRIILAPLDEPETTADPVDWDDLQSQYEYWRRRYYKNGYFNTRFEVFLK